MSIEERLKSMGIVLGDAPKPVAAYVPAVRAGDFVYVSGQLPTEDGLLPYVGHVGQEVSEAEGYAAAQLSARNALSALKALVGDLDEIEQIVKLTGFVSSAPGFNAQPKVVNGASEFLSTLFGESGQHARSAVGVSELPLNAPVEIELIVKMKRRMR